MRPEPVGKSDNRPRHREIIFLNVCHTSPVRGDCHKLFLNCVSGNKQRIRRRNKGNWLLLLLFIASACAHTDHPDGFQSADIEQQLRDEIRRWRHTPYQWGGTSPNGTDCSGLVMSVYRNVFGIHLPRSTDDQIRTGDHVAPGSLRAGDLVFFMLPEKIRHVGIYLGRGAFVHTSSTRNVTVSHLHDAYWCNSYETSRRILQENPVIGSAN